MGRSTNQKCYFFKTSVPISLLLYKTAVAQKLLILTRISLTSFLWFIVKQHSPRCDATERGISSWTSLFAKRNFIEKLNKKIKITPDGPTNDSGLIQMITMGETIHHKRVNSNTDLVYTCKYEQIIWPNRFETSYEA